MLDFLGGTCWTMMLPLSVGNPRRQVGFEVGKCKSHRINTVLSA